MKAGGALLSRAFANDTWIAYIGHDIIHPADLKIGPNSINVTLNSTILIPDANQWLDLKKASTCHYNEFEMAEDGYVLFPHGFVLGAVNERFDCDKALSIPFTNTGSNNLKDILFAQEVHGRSTLGRCGLCIHATAGYGDYGFKGAFTLEIFNVTNRPIVIYPGIEVAQVEFNSVHQPLIYSGSYTGENHYVGPVAPNLQGRF